jgi:spore maturation protein CgeB
VRAQWSLLVVGNPDEVHVGAHLLAAAATLGIPADLIDVRPAYSGPMPVRRALWWADRRPPHLGEFGRQVVSRAKLGRHTVVLATGLAPIPADAQQALGDAGVTRINLLTDDPWNAAHRSRWFLEALPHYDHVFSPRSAVQADLSAAGVPRVHNLPFAYNPAVHFPQPTPTADPQDADRCDVLVVGGADRDRADLMGPLLATPLSVRLHGVYWERFAATRSHARGMLDATGLRRATSAARMTVVMLRRANRDDHTMRTFEAPAMRGALLVERSTFHADLFGAEDDAVRYFTSGEELAAKALVLAREPEGHERLAARAHERITNGRHTYVDRLKTMLESVA